jgi:hypothetical protein
MRRRSLLPAALVTVALLSGCGGANQADQVRAKVQQFARAVAAHDYATLCRQVLAPRLLADIVAGGLTCPQAMRIGLARVQGARLVIGSVSVNGSHASVQALSQAVHEATLLTTLELVRTGGGWRVASLGRATG